MATRKPDAAAQPAEPPDADVLSTALARAVCLLARELPGGPASMRQILMGQVGLSVHHADAILAAAERT